MAQRQRLAARGAGAAARWLARHAGRSRWRWRLAAGLAGLARHRLGPRRGAAALAASTLSMLAEAGLLAAAFETVGTPVPWRGLLLAYAAGQLGGMEGGVLGALALTGTHPATALTAVIVYRVAGYWAPGAAGAITAAVLTRRHPARAARPPAPLRPQAPPPPTPGQPPSPRQAASAAGARAARPWSGVVVISGRDFSISPEPQVRGPRTIRDPGSSRGKSIEPTAELR